MSHDLFDILRAADPSANMPETTTDDRERLRRAIVATPLDSRRRLPRRHARPRRLLVAGIAGGLILMSGGGVYAATVLLEPLPKGHAMRSAQQVRHEYWSWTHKLILPPGASWGGMSPDPGVVDTRRVSVPKAAGAFEAVLEAWGNWALEWIAATKAGDSPRAAVAEGWVTRLWALVPITTGSDQSVPGTDPASSAYWNGAIAEAKAGSFDKVRRLARQLVPGLIKVEPYPTPTHFLGFTSSGYGSSDDMNEYEITADQARAEYGAVERAVGVPPGVNLNAPREVLGNHTLGDGFTQAFDDVWTAWWREWVAAAKAGDQERIAAAEAATARLQELLPHTLSHSGRNITWALAASPRRDLEQLAARARKGDMRGIEQWVAFQDAYARIMREIAGYDE